MSNLVPDYALGFANKSAVVTLLSVLQESKPLNEDELMQWLARPGISLVRAKNTISLLVHGDMLDEKEGVYTPSPDFSRKMSTDGIEVSYKEHVLGSVPQDSLRLFVKNASLPDSGKLVWWVESVSPFLASLRDLFLSLDLLILKNGYMESSDQLVSHLYGMGLVYDLYDVEDRRLRVVTIEELLIQLEKKDEYGKFAEQKAMQYERERLYSSGKTPLQISEINVAAGYDIESYENSKSHTVDRFIEVKSCADDTYKFYISLNEIDTAKIKGDEYYLYLYNRQEDMFKIVKNPHLTLFKSNQWVTKARLFEVHSI